MREFVLGLEELSGGVEELYKSIEGYDIVFLEGKVGSGKTTLVQALAKFLKINDAISSPTFSIQNVYDEKLFHYDMYQKNFEELFSLGLLESFEEDGLHVIEWGDAKLKDYLWKFGHKVVTIKILEDKNRRVYRIEDA